MRDVVGIEIREGDRVVFVSGTRTGLRVLVAGVVRSIEADLVWWFDGRWMHASAPSALKVTGRS